MMSSDKGVSNGCQQKRSAGGYARRYRRTYESPIDVAYGAKSAHSGNCQSELVGLYIGIVIVAGGRTD